MTIERHKSKPPKSIKNAPLATNTSVDRVSKIRIFFSPNMSKKVPIVVVQMASNARKPYISFERHQRVLLLSLFEDLFVEIVGYFISKTQTSNFVFVHGRYTYTLLSWVFLYIWLYVEKKRNRENICCSIFPQHQ